MYIKTKYNIGDHIIYINILDNGLELEEYDTYINYISVLDTGIEYITKDDYITIAEKDVILYDDKEKLIKNIYEKMKLLKQKVWRRTTYEKMYF